MNTLRQLDWSVVVLLVVLGACAGLARGSWEGVVGGALAMLAFVSFLVVGSKWAGLA